MTDEIYTFSEVMDRIELRKYYSDKKSIMGRPRYDAEKLMKVILFAFMENGYSSLRNIEKLCKTDIRYIWLLDGEKAPSFVTVSNFLREYVGKKSCLKSRDKVYRQLTDLIGEINTGLLSFFNVRIEPREEYAIEYPEEVGTANLSQKAIQAAGLVVIRFFA